ncbi:hypothetical protein Tco_0304314 [Tanacetum coccineum]
MKWPNVPLPSGIVRGSPKEQRSRRWIHCAKTKGPEMVPTPPCDSPLLRVYTLGSDEGRVTLVTPTHSQEDQPEDRLGVFSATKVLADATKENVYTYTRRRRAVSTGSGEISTASRLFSTAKESVSTAGASMPVSTAGMVQEVNISIPSPVIVKDKCKGKMEESDDEQTKRTKL